MAALAAAMGIGRFAFTPLLPMMLHDGVVDIATGSWLATANYAGYLAGALLYMALPWLGRRLGAGAAPGNATLVRGGLVATVLLTGLLALPWPASWPLLRLLAGVASALVFLGTANWCMGRLAHLRRPALEGLIFCGPGLGIVFTGLPASAMVAAGWTAASGWAAFAVLAAALCAGGWWVFQGGETPAPAPAGRSHAAALPPAAHPVAERTLLAVAYGLAGLGYIVTATFLPVIARAGLPAGSAWPDLFWPSFGAGVALGALLSTRIAPTRDRRKLLAVAYLLQAGAIALPLLWSGRAGFALGSLLLGLPFTAITFFALQEARHQWPQAGAGFTGLMTALYGIGQIAGPPMAAALLARAGSQAQGFDWALGVAGSVLVMGAVIYGLMAWHWRAVHQIK